MTAPSHSPSLTAPPRRIHDVDALRGFALLGIFVVNITFMASAYPGNLVDDPLFATPPDDAARLIVAVLFSMKFYLLFSFLFGYSFVLQMESAQRAGRADRKSTRLNSSHVAISYAVFCLKKKITFLL